MFKEKKFENIITLENGWEILSTDSKFHNITHIGKTIPYEIWEIKTLHYTLSCADTHIVFDKDNNEIFVKDLSVGTIIQTTNGLEPIIDIHKTTNLNNMFDIQVDSYEHSYLTNGIKSHNSTLVVCFLLWYILFNEDKKCAILANKAMQAKEILSRVQLGYIHLPKWLQAGVKSWGKNSIELENGSMLLAAATSSDSVRGFSFSCVFIDECIGGDSIITIKHNSTGEIKKTTIENFWNICSSNYKHYSNIIENKNWSVLTSDGYQKFYGIKKTRKQSIKLIFNDDTHIICSLEHKFYENKNYIYANTLKIGDVLSDKKIIDIQNNGETDLYDLLEVQNGHHYTMSGVEGSNCAFIPKNIWEKFYTSTMPTISSGKESKLILVSCVTKDTIVFTPDGLKAVQDFIQEDNTDAYIVPEYTVLGKNGYNRGNIMVNSGYADTKIISTLYSELECSLNHKLWACKDNICGWYKASELEIGDKISIRCGMNLYCDYNINEINYYLNKGTIVNNNIIYYSYDKSEIKKLQLILLDYGVLSTVYTYEENDIKKYEIRFPYDLKSNRINDSIYWDTINNIQDSSNKVYDFSLYNISNDTFSHSVIYNGIVGHQTPNGENHYYNFWTRAIEGKSNMVPYEVNWWDVPGRDEEWRKETLKNMTEDQFNVEYGNSFDSGANTLISPYIFPRLSKNISDPIQSTKSIKIHELPIKDHIYILTADCAQGTGLDYSTISIIDITKYPYKQVCIFKDNMISHLSFPQIILQLAMKYNNAEVLIESNDIGNTILHILNYDLEYENIVKTYSQSSRTVVLGQKTTIKTKSNGCSRIKDMIESNLLIILNEETLTELRHFVLKGQSYEAEVGYHDDLVMGLVNFAYYASTPNFRMKYDENFPDEYRKENDQKILESLSPLPIFSSQLGQYEDTDTSWLQ